MAELPERRVLKDVLGRLKAKTLFSRANVDETIRTLMDRFQNTIEKITKDFNEAKTPEEKALFLQFKDLFVLIQWTVFHSVSEFNSTLEDMKLYIESLEKYSAELDKTLNEIFDQARKQAEEQIKQQEEIRKHFQITQHKTLVKPALHNQPSKVSISSKSVGQTD